MAAAVSSQLVSMARILTSFIKNVIPAATSDEVARASRDLYLDIIPAF